VVPADLPLHVVGNQLENSLNQPVVLRGVNVDSLEFAPDGGINNVLQAVQIAASWHANLIRLPVNEDFWFGSDTDARVPPQIPDPTGANYQALIAQVISMAEADGMYVMLDLHWSDMGVQGSFNDQHEMPDANSVTFWSSAAAVYANDPGVLFDAYNEPALGGDPAPASAWPTWLNGGSITETYQGTPRTYQSPGMQALITAIRGTGANNVIAAEGLNYGSDLSPVLNGYALTDPASNLMYSSHLYPNKMAEPTVLQSVLAVGQQYPIYVGEWGDGGVISQGVFKPTPGAAAGNRSELYFLNLHHYSWSAYVLNANYNELNLITNWTTPSPSSPTPTPDFGQYVKNDLAESPPTLVTVAQASASPVTGRTTQLSALASYAGGQVGLTYTWTTTGTPPAVVHFLPNGTSAARNTTATFSAPGVYQFLVTIANADGLNVTSSVTVTVDDTPTALIHRVSTHLGSTLSEQLSVVLVDQFGVPVPVQPGFTWSVVQGPGSISNTGLYTGPVSPRVVIVQAAAGKYTARTTINSFLSFFLPLPFAPF
jgi:hypothetical protein